MRVLLVSHDNDLSFQKSEDGQKFNDFLGQYIPEYICQEFINGLLNVELGSRFYFVCIYMFV